MNNSINIGGLYRFKNGSRSGVKKDIRGKWFRVISDDRIVVYDDDGSIILNGAGEPYFTYSGPTGSILKHIEPTSIEPFRCLPKFSFCVEG